MNIFNPSDIVLLKQTRQKKASHTLRVKCLVDNKLSRLAFDATKIETMVSEVNCSDVGCVPIETLVILVGQHARMVSKVLKPIAEVDSEDIESAVLIPINWNSKTFPRKEEVTIREKLHGHLSPIQDPNDILREIESAERFLRLVRDNLLLPAESSEERAAATTTTAASDTAIQARREQNISSSVFANDDPVVGVGVPSMVVTEVDMHPTATTTKETTLQPSGNYSNSSSGSSSYSSGGGKFSSFRVNTVLNSSSLDHKPRHEKGGVRQRGCPCCDPDNIDNIVDKILFLDTPP